MTETPSLFIDLAPRDVAQLNELAHARGMTLDALANEIIGEYLIRYALDPDERRELASMREADRRYDWDHHEAMVADDGMARDAAE